MCGGSGLREVKEETGAAVRHLKYVGQYKVLGREKVIVKNIYFADIEKLEKQADYFETKGRCCSANCRKISPK